MGTGSSVKLSESDFVPNLAVILAVVDAFTAFVVIEKLADVSPAETLTVDGTDAELELLLRLTEIPAVGAAEPSVTVPDTIEAPLAALAPSARAVNAGGSTVSEAVLLVVPSFALTVAVVVAATGVVDTLNVAEVEPDGTVTEDATVADLLEEVSEITAPLAPAFFDKVTVPVAPAPPATAVGDRLTLVIVWAMASGTAKTARKHDAQRRKDGIRSL